MICMFTSAPTPANGQPSSTVTIRFVFFTLATIVSMSSGRSERRLMTSASMPCSASASAAYIATPTMMLKATRVTRSPARSIFARPIGSTKSSDVGHSKLWP